MILNHLILNNAELQRKFLRISLERDGVFDNYGKAKIIHPEKAVDLIVKYWKSKNFRRVIIGIGGFPGSGKTTLSKLLVRNINNLNGGNVSAHLPMDGFHFSNQKLNDNGWQEKKGDVITYDVTRFSEKLNEFIENPNSNLFAPDYIREIHNVVEDKIEIDRNVRILITEGIYVGYSGGDWIKVKNLLNMLFFLDEDLERCVDNIIARNMEVDRRESVIKRKLNNDLLFMKNSILILNEADFIIRL